jgi:hypothetical protein
MADKQPYLVRVVKTIQDEFVYTAASIEDATFLGPRDGVQVLFPPCGETLTITAERIDPKRYDELFEAAIHRPEALPR